MNNIKDFIQSGILESYVMGIATTEETQEVESMAITHQEIRDEIEAVKSTLENYAQLHAISPNPTIKPLLMAFIDYTERLQKGEQITLPPVMNDSTKIDDFSPWLNRKDMQMPSIFEEYFARIISYSPEIITAIAWIKDIAPAEAHHHEHEKFLIIEGTCDIIVEDKSQIELPRCTN